MSCGAETAKDTNTRWTCVRVRVNNSSETERYKKKKNLDLFCDTVNYWKFTALGTKSSTGAALIVSLVLVAPQNVFFNFTN